MAADPRKSSGRGSTRKTVTIDLEAKEDANTGSPQDAEPVAMVAEAEKASMDGAKKAKPKTNTEVPKGATARPSEATPPPKLSGSGIVGGIAGGA
ncbi:MAG: hypothetical protein AAFO77_09685, partial [Pseudomonadota bacterium]